MVRKIIHIDENKCNGCGACAAACHEGAIGMVDGKARLLRDDYCDGLGDCLPACPTGAITFTEREAAEYNEEAVMKNKMKNAIKNGQNPLQGGCPGSRMHTFHRNSNSAVSNNPSEAETQTSQTYCNQQQNAQTNQAAQPPFGSQSNMQAGQIPQSQLGQWPCQIKLVPVNAPYFNGAKLLIAADCTAYAYARMHEEFMRGKITIIGCPKLDDIDYSEKLTEIIKNNDIQSVTIVRMEVPCCGGLEYAAKKALQASGKFIPWQVVTISIDGKILD